MGLWVCSGGAGKRTDFSVLGFGCMISINVDGSDGARPCPVLFAPALLPHTDWIFRKQADLVHWKAFAFPQVGWPGERGHWSVDRELAQGSCWDQLVVWPWLTGALPFLEVPSALLTSLAVRASPLKAPSKHLSGELPHHRCEAAAL